mgnify:CR=1 FL=1
MSRQPWEVFGGENIVVTSGIDPGVTVSLRNDAWVVLETRGLSIPQVIIENRVAPGEVGSTELPGAENELRTSLPFQITGTHFVDGTAYAVSPQIGLRRNWVYLVQHLIRPSRDGALDAVYQSIDPDEAPIPFRIQFPAPEIPGGAVAEWTCNLPVVLPNGALVPEAAGS